MGERIVKTMDIVKPIFIIGTGRSGTTIFHRIFSYHPTVTWLSSRLSNRYPRKPQLNQKLMQGIDYPLLGPFLRKRFLTGEAYNFWETYSRGFTEPCRDLTAADVSEKVKRDVRRAFSQTMTGKRDRLLIKITGWPRIGFLQEIFPDARFIHVKRDERSVVNSLLNIDWWSGWRGPHNWRWGELTPAQYESWLKFDRSFVALACIEMQILSEAMKQAKQSVKKSNFREIDYDDLCADPMRIYQEVVDFCELDWGSDFARVVQKQQLRNTNYKWREDLTSEQQRILEHFFPTGDDVSLNGSLISQPELTQLAVE